MIGVVTTSYPRHPQDGAGNFVRRRVDALRAAGESVEIIAAGDGDETPGVVRIPAPDLFYGGGAPDRLEAGGSWAHAVAFSLQLWRALDGRRGVWDRVESHWLMPCGVLVRSVFPLLPHRLHVHGGDVYLLKRLPWARSLARALCTPRTTLVFASAGLRRAFESIAGWSVDGRVAGAWIESAPIDTQVFRPRDATERARARDQLSLAGRVILSAGRLVPVKGMDLLVRAVARLPGSPLLIIAGDGPQRESLLALARTLGVALRLPGQVPADELATFMAAADVYVQPSRVLSGGRGEGMPLAVREALARGLPVVATDSGGMADLRENPGVSLVPANDPRALAAAMAKVA